MSRDDRRGVRQRISSGVRRSPGYLFPVISKRKSDEKPIRGAFPISAPSMTKQDADEQTHYTMHSFRSEGSNSTGTRRVRCIYHYDAGLLEALSDSVEVHAPYGSGGARSHRQCHDYGGVSIIEEGNKRVPSERAEP